MAAQVTSVSGLTEGGAERSELSRPTIQRIESGVGIKYVHLLRISKVLDVPLADLVG